MKKIETITREDRTIVQVGFNDDIRMDMQEKIKQIYNYYYPKDGFYSTKQDFSRYYPFDIDQLSDWIDVLDWEKVSSNRQVKWSNELIRKFRDRLDGCCLWLNNAVLCWDIELLEEFENEIAWDFISCSSVKWNEKLHKRFEKHFSPSLFKYDDIVERTSGNREKFIEQGGISSLSDNFMKLYLYAKEIDDEQGIFILYDAIRIYFNNKANIVPIKHESSPL